MRDIKWPAIVSYAIMLALALGAINFANKMKVTIDLAALIALFGLLASSGFTIAWYFYKIWKEKEKERDIIQREKDIKFDNTLTDISKTLKNVASVDYVNQLNASSFDYIKRYFEIEDESKIALSNTLRDLDHNITDLGSKLKVMNDVLLDYVEDEGSKIKLKLSKP
jgi:uncharacterized membrane protein